MKKQLKPRSDSKIAALTPEQRKILETWLFEKNMSYRLAIRKALAEFQVRLDIHALMDFYRKIQQQRTVDHIIASSQYANAVVKAFAKYPGREFKAVENILGHITFNLAAANSEAQQKNPLRKPLNLQPLGQALDLLVVTREDDREAQKVALEREKWEFDVVRVVRDHHAELERITKDESLDEDARLLAIRKSLFGDAVRD